MAVRTAPERVAAESEQAAQTIHPRSAPLAGFSGTRRVHPPVNEPVKSYAPGSPERAEVKARLKQMANERVEIPIIIGGQEIRTGETAQSVMPHNHRHVLADYHKASASHVQKAIDAAREARAEWANWAWEDRAAVFLKASELLATSWRATVNASRVFEVFRDRGTLNVGAPADVAVLELRQGSFEFVDNYGNKRTGRQRLFPKRTVLGGKLVPPRA